MAKRARWLSENLKFCPKLAKGDAGICLKTFFKTFQKVFQAVREESSGLVVETGYRKFRQRGSNSDVFLGGGFS